MSEYFMQCIYVDIFVDLGRQGSLNKRALILRFNLVCLIKHNILNHLFFVFVVNNKK